jgi:hypothetical protein
MKTNAATFKENAAPLCFFQFTERSSGKLFRGKKPLFPIIEFVRRNVALPTPLRNREPAGQLLAEIIFPFLNFFFRHFRHDFSLVFQEDGIFVQIGIDGLIRRIQVKSSNH